MNTESNIAVNQAKPENNSTVLKNISGNSSAKKWNLADTRIKELLAKKEVSEAIELYVTVPEEVFIKKVKKAFKPDDAKDTTQKIEVMSGTTLEDAITFEITLLNTEIDPVQAVNKKFRIIDFTFALEANMNAGKFSGYAATGLKLMVTKLEEVK